MIAKDRTNKSQTRARKAEVQAWANEPTPIQKYGVLGLNDKKPALQALERIRSRQAGFGRRMVRTLVSLDSCRSGETVI